MIRAVVHTAMTVVGGLAILGFLADIAVGLPVQGAVLVALGVVGLALCVLDAYCEDRQRARQTREVRA